MARRPDQGTAPRHVLVLASGPVPSPATLDAAWPGWADAIDLVIAADGGARHAGSLGRALDRWVGDGDSVDPGLLGELRAAGVAIELVSEDKDESDTELAVLAAAATGTPRITILGALGGPRLDHELANLGLLAHPALARTDLRLFDGRPARVSPLVPGSNPRLEGRAGDIVTLLPFGGDAVGVTTDGLRYPLRDEDLTLGPARGLSNVRVGEVATVTLRSGRLLVIETPANLAA